MAHTTPKPKKAKSMSRMVTDSSLGHRILEIADPIRDKNENEVTKRILI